MVRSGEMADRTAERTPFGFAALAAALAFSVGGPAALAQTTPGAPTTGAPTSTSASAAGPEVLVEADQVIDDDVAHTVTAQGDVEVRYQGRTMRADQLVYNLERGSIHASGDVEIVAEDGSVTYANEIETDDKLNVGVATELRGRAPDAPPK